MTKKLYLLLFCFIIFTFIFPSNIAAAGNTYYVSKSGCSDSNSGSISAPFCSITSGISVMQPGDTLMLRAGAYSNFEVTKSGSNGNYLTIQAYNGEKVTISGGSSAILLIGKSFIDLKGLEVTGATGSYAAGILIKNSSNNNIVENCSVHNNSGSKTHGVIIDSSANNIVRNCDVYNNFEVGLKIQGTSSGNQLIGNTVYGHVGDPPNSDGIAVSDTSYNNKVQDNDVYGNGDDGIDTWSSHGSIIIGNKSHNNGVGGDGNGFKMGGTGTGGSNTIIGNISYNNPRDGFDSNHSGNNTYINNIAYKNGSVGFQDGEGKFSPCSVSTCKTTYINNIGYNNSSVNFNASEFTAVSHNNIWYSDSGNPLISYKGANYVTLASFFAGSGNRLDNPNDGTLSSIIGNPMFVNPGTGNFNLNQNSPAINAGDPANPGHINAKGRPDIGALEFGGTPGTPIATNTPAPTPTLTPKPTSTPQATSSPTGNPKVGDVNGDGTVNIIDIGIIIDYYGQASTANPKADVSGDGTINIIDIGIVIDHYGN